MMVYFIHRGVRGRQARQIVAGSFSVVSTPNFAMKASVESSRRDLHNTEFLWEFVRKVLQLREVAASFALAREYWCGFHAPVASQGSFSAVSKRNFASKFSLESSCRDVHNALLCTALKSHFFLKNC